jgi:hypothetical protein
MASDIDVRFGSQADLFTYSSSTTASGGKAGVKETLIQGDAPECLLFPIPDAQILISHGI